MFCITTLAIALLAVYIGIFTSGARQGNLPDSVKGLSGKNFSNNFDPDYDDNITFHGLISIFYPAVIGFFSGTSKSQELKHPSRNVPYGTLMSLLISSIIYLSIIFMIAGSCTRDELKNNSAILFTIAWPTHYLVSACVIIVCCGASLQCISGSTEILVSIANDDILPIKWFKNENRALNITVILIAGLVCIASLDSVAPIITMFFLLFDASINIACTLLSLLNNPS